MDAVVHQVKVEEQATGDGVFAELMLGLDRADKYISPKFFYDERGSRLFDDITRLPEYYPTRTEAGILTDNLSDIARWVGKHCLLIEPGAGSCHKVTYLLDALKPCAYVPQDISVEFLRDTAVRLKAEYPWLDVHPLGGDFHDDILLPFAYPNTRRVVFYPGSTIGNFEPTQATRFLVRMRHIVGESGGMIIGVDLQKDRSVLHAAYNDAAGVTERFNLNILTHLNRLLDADFCPANFAHQAFYNESCQRIEMHLESRLAHTVQCGDTQINLEKGECIHTENSYKYTLESFAQLASSAGLVVRQTWLDGDKLFSVHYLEPAAG